MTLYLTEELLSESDEVLGGAVAQMVRMAEEDAREKAAGDRMGTE